MNIDYVKGDLIEMTKEGHFDAVGHGVNCFHTMGSGIAPLINYLSGGKLLEIDKATPYGDINKLGTFTDVANVVNGNRVEFFNLYTQHTFGSTDDGRILIHWESLYDALHSMVGGIDGTRIGIPAIGCGLAGGKFVDFVGVMNRLSRLEYSDDFGEPISITVVSL